MALNAEVIHGFVGSVLAHRFDQSVSTPECHLEWWELCCSPDPFISIAAPRGHAKSTAITHCYTLACVLFREDEFVLLVSDTYAQGVMFLQDIRNELADNDLIHELFGEIVFEKDSENDIIVRMSDGHLFRVMALGSEQKVRGIKWNHKRPSKIIGDDMENDEIVMNPDRREKFRNWIYKALLPARSAKGKVRFVGTILHMDSFLENTMPKAWDKVNYVDDGLKVYSKKTVGGWRSVKYRAHPRIGDFSKILWKERWPKEKLLEEYARYAEAGRPDSYAQEYLNNPIDETRAYFKRSELQAISMEEKQEIKNKSRPLLYYFGVDFAISDKQRADYTVIVVGGVDSDGMLYIVDVYRERMDGKEIVETVLDLAERYQPEMIGVEQGMIQKSLGPFFEIEMARRDKYYYLYPMVPSVDKQVRARGIQGRIRQGKVKFDKGSDWWPVFEEELVSFPRGIHDDQVDSLAWLGLMLNRLNDAPTVQEQEEEEYTISFKQSYADQGRSAITGY